MFKLRGVKRKPLFPVLGDGSIFEERRTKDKWKEIFSNTMVENMT